MNGVLNFVRRHEGTAMNTLVEELARRAKALSPEDRARLAEDLLASLDPEPTSEAEADAAWHDEIGRRVQAVRDGTARLVAADEVYAEIERLRVSR